MRTQRSKLVVGIAAAAVVVAAAGGGFAYETAQSNERQALAAALAGGDPSKAADHIQQFGCSGCHTIAGIRGANGMVGPPLQQIRERVIVGSRPNTVENLVEWIVNPKSINSQTPMPMTGISPSQARDVVAYLYAR
jgi:cytochrome c2